VATHGSAPGAEEHTPVVTLAEREHKLSGVSSHTHKLAAVSMLRFSSSVAIRPLLTGLISESRSACTRQRKAHTSINQGERWGPVGRTRVPAECVQRVNEEIAAGSVLPCPGQHSFVALIGSAKP
jgi:hypothetical protein